MAKRLLFLQAAICAGLWFAASGVQAACSPYLGQVVFNEVFDKSPTTFIELKTLNSGVASSTTNFTGWTVELYKGNASAVSTANLNTEFTTLSKNTCGPTSPWIIIPDASLGNKISGAGSTDLNFVLKDSTGGIVDILRMGSATSFFSGAGSACSTIESAMPGAKYDAAWGAGGTKDWYRTPDGSGIWGGRDTANNSDTACNNNNSNTAFTVSKIANAASVPVNTNFTFTLFAQNGNNSASLGGVQVTDNLSSAGLTFVSCTTASGTCTNLAGVVTWNIGPVATASSKSATLTVSASNAGAKTNTISSNTAPAATATATVQIYSPLADWRMDESAWNGTSGEVKDSSGNGYHGTAARAAGATVVASTASGSPAFTSGTQTTCGYGDFDRASGPTRSYSYVALSSIPALPSSFTFAAWIRSTNASQSGQRILVRDDADNGWGFSLGDPGQAKIRFFNRNITNAGNVTGDGSNPNCGVFCLDTAAVITNNAWFFVAVAIDTSGKTVTHYVYDSTGVLVSNTSSAFAGTWVDGTGTAAIGGETSASSEGRQTSFHFNGNIDELQIYSGVLAKSDLDVLRTRSRNCTTAVDHVELVHNGSGLTCSPQAVTVLGCTTSASCNGVAANQTVGTFTFTPTAISGAQWCSDALCASPISGAVTLSNNATLYLREPIARTDTMAGASTGTTNATVQCTNTATATFGSSAAACGVAFASAGFLVNVPSHVACTAQNVTIQAVQSNATTTACVPAFNNVTRNVSVYSGYTNPTTGTKTASFNYVTSSGGATSTVASLSTASGMPTMLTGLYFDTTGTARLSSFSYPDAGQVTLFPTYIGSAATNDNGLSLSAVSGNTFIAAPANFAFTAIPAAPLTAGSPFNVTVTANNACATPAATPNFGKETTPATVSLGSTNPQPALGNATVISQVMPGFVSGAANTNVIWKEVGTMDLTAATSNYLGSVLSATGTQTAVGRFKPAYFDTAVTQGCSSFTYSGQPFVTVVTAKATGGTTAANYAGTAWARLVTLSDANAGTGTWSGNTISAGSFAAGIGNAANASYTFLGRRTVPTAIKLRATEPVGADGVSSSTGTEGTTNVRSGRVRLQNAYGSELLALALPATIEYYDTTTSTGWRAGADTCTTLTRSNVGFSTAPACTPALTTCPTAVTAAGSGGQPSVFLAKPSGTSSLCVTLNLSAALTGNQCLAPGATSTAAVSAGYPWLQFEWLGGAAINPTARATFGIYKSPLIYRRENY